MVPTLVLACVTGVPLSDAVVDRIVSTRTVVVERKVKVEVVVYQGDPLGTREAGTLKVLARPALMAVHKQTAFCQVTGPEHAGTVVRVTPCLRLDGKIGMECDTQVATVNRGRGITTAAGFTPGIDTEACNTSVVLTPGQPHKVRMAARSIEDQTWMELTATVVEGVPTAGPAVAQPVRATPVTAYTIPLTVTPVGYVAPPASVPRTMPSAPVMK